MKQLRQTASNTVVFGYHSFSEAGNVKPNTTVSQCSVHHYVPVLWSCVRWLIHSTVLLTSTVI